MPSFISPTTPLSPPLAPAPPPASLPPPPPPLPPLPLAPMPPFAWTLPVPTPAVVGDTVDEVTPDPPPPCFAAAAAAADNGNPPGGCGEDKETRPTHGSGGMKRLSSSGCCFGGGGDEESDAGESECQRGREWLTWVRFARAAYECRREGVKAGGQADLFFPSWCACITLHGLFKPGERNMTLPQSRWLRLDVVTCES